MDELNWPMSTEYLTEYGVRRTLTDVGLLLVGGLCSTQCRTYDVMLIQGARNWENPL